jgi:hypothetical protein
MAQEVQLLLATREALGKIPSTERKKCMNLFQISGKFSKSDTAWF